MPQLDKLTYSTQIFWLLILFTTFYFFILKNILPKMLLNIKVRETKMSNILLDNENSSSEALNTNNMFIKTHENIIKAFNSSIDQAKTIVTNSWTHANIAISHTQHLKKDITVNKNIVFSKLLTSKIKNNE